MAKDNPGPPSHTRTQEIPCYRHRHLATGTTSRQSPKPQTKNYAGAAFSGAFFSSKYALYSIAHIFSPWRQRKAGIQCLIRTTCSIRSRRCSVLGSVHVLRGRAKCRASLSLGVLCISLPLLLVASQLQFCLSLKIQDRQRASAKRARAPRWSKGQDDVEEGEDRDAGPRPQEWGGA